MCTSANKTGSCRACVEDCTTALAAMPQPDQDCAIENEGTARMRARLLSRRASAYVRLGELPAAVADYEQVRAAAQPLHYRGWEKNGPWGS